MEGTKDSTVVLRKLRRRKDKDDSNYDKLNPKKPERLKIIMVNANQLEEKRSVQQILTVSELASDSNYYGKLQNIGTKLNPQMISQIKSAWNMVILFLVLAITEGACGWDEK